MRMTRAAITKLYQELITTALGQLKKTRVDTLALEPELKVVLGSLPGGFDTQFFEDIKSFVSLEDDSSQEDFIINSFLEHSSAATPLAPPLNLGKIRLTTLPYHRSLARPYDYSKFNFSKALLHHEALINAIKGGGDISNIAWDEVGPNPKVLHSVYSDQEKAAYLLIQTITVEARNLQKTLSKTPAGFESLFNRILNPEHGVLLIRQELQDLFTAKRSWWLTYCINSFFRGRAAVVEEFYQKWSKTLSGEIELGEATGLLSGKVVHRAH